ncbi:MAG: peptide synthetase [Gammaproteobacteria bacterium]|nr:peptide synthetase [Gammaproteobacteria bacterium]|tara:strand:+ start:2420 stop:3004 length:585 start_codon:yes stop_codon:yes gene_type:complete
MKAKIRKVLVVVEDTCKEMNRSINPITRKAAALAVIENPCAGEFIEDLEILTEIGAELGEYLGQRAVAALGVEPHEIESFGKAAIVGINGELEHAAAILHPCLGKPLRLAVQRGAALIPSSKKMGVAGTAIDIPLGHKDAAHVRSHFDAMEVRLNDGPKNNEILVAVSVTDSGRPLPRVGGLTQDDVIGKDGLR